MENGGVGPIPERHPPQKGLEITPEQLQANNAAQRGEFEDLLRSAVEPRQGRYVDDKKLLEDTRAKANEPVALMPPPKNLDSILNKLDRKAEKYGPEGVTDVNRATILVEDLSEIPRAFNDFRAAAEAKGWRMADFEDAFTGPSKDGYRDLSILVKRPGPPYESSFMEVQFNVNDFWAAKGSKQGHGLYDQLKEYLKKELKAKREGDTARVAELEVEAAPIKKEMREMYEATWGGMDLSSLPRWYRPPEAGIDDYVVAPGTKLPRVFADGLKEGTDQLGQVFNWPAARKSGEYAPEDRIVVRTATDPTETWEAQFLPEMGNIEFNDALLDRQFLSPKYGTFKVDVPARQRINTMHEWGHRLDWRLNDLLFEPSKYGPAPMTDTADALRSDLLTEKVRESLPELEEEMVGLMNAFYDSRWYQKVDRFPIDQELKDYLREPREMFARAVAQYTARNTGDTDALAMLDWKHKHEMAAWTPDDFSAIEDAMAKLFSKLGLLR